MLTGPVNPLGWFPHGFRDAAESEAHFPAFSTRRVRVCDYEHSGSLDYQRYVESISLQV